MITLGIINGGLGLKLTGDNKKGEIAYGVIAGTLWTLVRRPIPLFTIPPPSFFKKSAYHPQWLAVVLINYFRRSPIQSGRNVGRTGEKISGGYSPNASSGDSPSNSYSLEERGAGTRR